MCTPLLTVTNKTFFFAMIIDFCTSRIKWRCETIPMSYGQYFLPSIHIVVSVTELHLTLIK